VIAERAAVDAISGEDSPMPPPLPSPPPAPSGVLDTPNWAEQVTGVATLALVIVTALPLLFTAYQLRQGRRGQQDQTFLEMTRRWNDPVFRRARIRIREYYDTNHDPNGVREKLLALRGRSKESYWECVEAINFFETLATLVRGGAIKLQTVDRVWGFIVWDYYSILYQFIRYQQQQPPPDETFGAEFKWLADAIADKNGYAKVWDQSDESPEDLGPGPGK
jgi:hypothetical protein